MESDFTVTLPVLYEFRSTTVFNTVDWVSGYVIFDVGGNKYRKRPGKPS